MRAFLRRFGAIAGVLLMLAAPASRADDPVYATVRPDDRLAFPRDHGAHPDYRTEWWYVTGWLKTREGDEVGFQVTFFRARVPTDESNPSRFAPKQLLFAHAAIADRKLGRLVHAERIARAGFRIAEAATDDAQVRLEDWRFERVAEAARDGATPLRFRTRVGGDDFSLDLELRGDAPPLEQGADAARPGFSQKGPSPREASHYYSVPQLAVTGTISRPSRPAEGAPVVRSAVTGTAWLDREWSSAYMNPQAVGWDWVGLNLDDGGALMAFQMRDHRGAKLWAGGARRTPDGRVERYAPEDVDFRSMRVWTSPVSGALWPVSQMLEIGRRFTADEDAAKAGITPLVVTVDPLMDNQELDSRASTGTIYWEGAVRVRRNDAKRTVIGRGYLELTGYWRPMKF